MGRGGGGGRSRERRAIESGNRWGVREGIGGGGGALPAHLGMFEVSVPCCKHSLRGIQRVGLDGLLQGQAVCFPPEAIGTCCNLQQSFSLSPPPPPPPPSTNPLQQDCVNEYRGTTSK